MLRATLTSLLFLAFAARAADGPLPLKPADHGVGRLIRDVAFTDIDGKPGRLSDFASSPALVVLFNKIGCPLSKKYAPVVNALEREYRKRGVAFLLVSVDPKATVDELKDWIRERRYEARFLPDFSAEFPKALYGSSSAEAFVLDRARTLVYRGPVDDQHGLGSSLPQPRRHYLKEALEAVLAGKPVAASALSAPGCVVKTPHDAVNDAGVTFHNRISRLLQANCQSCHRPGENGPFPLITYRDAVRHGAMIEYMVNGDLMPPWFANPKYGQWANDRSLNAEDKEAILGWAAGDQAEGDPKDAPLPVVWTPGWQIGTPDATLTIPKPIPVAATGVMPYQYVRVKNPFGEDRWIEAMEIRVTAPQVVHHVLVLQRKPGEPLGGNAGLDGFFAAMVPGNAHAVFPPGVGRKLEKDAELLFQIHYTPNGTATEDRPTLGIRFAKETPRYELKTGAAYDATFVIPAHAANHEVAARYEFKKRSRIFSFMPHMHLRGKAFRYKLVYPDGKSEIVLDVPRYDFNWQLLYELRVPKDVPAGTRLEATAWYDNSAGNPNNPDPTIPVGFGEQTHEEMMIGYFNWHSLE